MKNVVFHYESLVLNKKRIKNNCKLLRMVKKLNKNIIINVYVPLSTDNVSSKYYLDEHKLPYDNIVNVININDHFVSTNTKELGDNKLAYLLAGREDKRIKPGNVVELVSGSYPMTVEAYNKTTKIVTASGIDANSQLETYEINADALKKTNMTWQEMIKLAKAIGDDGDDE